MLSFPKSLSRSKILVVTERYWPEGSGGELATHLVVDILRSKFEVTVITGTANPSRAPGVEYVYEPLLTKREKPILWLNTLRLIETDRFRRQLSESDLVYVPRFAFPIIPYAKKAGKKVVVHLHGYIPISYTAVVLAPYEEHRHRIALDDIGVECAKGFRYCVGARTLWWLPKLAKKMVSQADKVVCVSKRQAEIIADQIPELEGKMEVIYNPIPPELLNLEPRSARATRPFTSRARGAAVSSPAAHSRCGRWDRGVFAGSRGRGRCARVFCAGTLRALRGCR